MGQAVDVKLMRGDAELPFEVLVDALFNKMMTPAEEEDENLDIYALGTKAGYMFLDKVASQFPDVQALFTLQPAISMHFVSMFIAGMMAKKALDKKENNITIELEIVKEDDALASQPSDSDNAQESCGTDTTDCSGRACSRATEDERAT